MRYRTLAFLVCGLGLIDRATKVFALSLTQGALATFVPYIELELEKNFGLAWNVGAEISKYVFIALMSIIICGFIYTIVLDWCQHTLPIAESLIVIGGVSNLFDRICHGFVIDFIRINVASYSLSVFNLADIYIALGLILMLQRAYDD